VIQLLTATGMRPEAFALCERWMAAQSYNGPATWFIVDDGVDRQALPNLSKSWNIEYLRAAPFWQPGQNTQARNLLVGLQAVDPAVPVAMIEDDDYYAPDWLDTVLHELECAELVGEQLARYYNVTLRRGMQLNNKRHASLCATALRDGALATFERACKVAPKFIDLELWHHHRDKHLFRGNRVVGIKGLPGRGGIGMGHRSDFKGELDLDGALLRSWIGSDASAYDWVRA
jgi:hypothetical protein